MSLYEARAPLGPDGRSVPVLFSAPAHWPHRVVREWASGTLFSGGRVWSLQRVG